MQKYPVFPQSRFNRRRCFFSYVGLYMTFVTVLAFYQFLFNIYRCAPYIVTSVTKLDADGYQFNSVIPAEEIFPIRCYDRIREYQIIPKGAFWVLNNYIPADRWFRCHETITFTTTADFTFLDNLEPLVSRWKGPISVAVYAPGTDFQLTLRSIKHVRRCYASLIREYVTFHVFFEKKHRPSAIPTPEDVLHEEVDCAVAPPWHDVNVSELYKRRKKLTFPINVGRNIARDGATTHFIFAADIELYPSANVIADFLEMARRPDSPVQANRRQVFVLQPFEVTKDARPPDTKDELVNMLANKTATFFHQKLCDECHRIPRLDEWPKTAITPHLQVFHSSKRGSSWWEPFYIGTNQEPYFDENLNWEGRLNKMTQAYAMCLLDYDYHVLNNAFLVHKPGIKKLKRDRVRDIEFTKNHWRVKKKSMPELHAFYGTSDRCNVITKPKRAGHH